MSIVSHFYEVKYRKEEKWAFVGKLSLVSRGVKHFLTLMVNTLLDKTIRRAEKAVRIYRRRDKKAKSS